MRILRVFAALSFGVLIGPVAAFAGSPGTTMDTAIPLPSLPFASYAGTMTPLVQDDDGDYMADTIYSAVLQKGQTAKFTVSPSPGFITIEATGYSTILSGGAESGAMESVTICAPRTGRYFLCLEQSDDWEADPATYTIAANVVKATYYRPASVSVPKTIRRGRYFYVGAELRPNTYNGLTMPLKFMFERKRAGRWRSYGSCAPRATDPSDLYLDGGAHARAKLPRGTFRVRARFADVGHVRATYGPWRTLRVK